MKKKKNNLSSILILASLVIVTLSLIPLQSFLSQKNSVDTRSKAAGNTLSVCTEGCQYAGADGLQQAITAAQNGDVINVAKGTYSGPNAIPMGLGGDIFVSASRGAADSCFIRIQDKTITLKGDGMQSVLFGEGHSKPNQAPYQTRAGICVVNGGLTLEGMKIKEFQKRCLVSYNSTIIEKNSQIEGCDEGGVSLLGNSKGVFVNNYFFSMNIGGVMLWQNSVAKIINNTFFDNGIMFFYHPGTNDQMHADFINNIMFSGQIMQVDWWPSELSKVKSNNNFAYDLIKQYKEEQDCLPTAYCDNFTGKISADPMFVLAVVDRCCGNAAWSDMGLQSGSPALGAGDPSIPGPKNIGISGGPCTDPESSMCNDFISQALSQMGPAATPTSTAPTSPPFNQPANPSSPPINNQNPPTSSQPTSGSQQTEPPITYYLPPTMSFSNPNQPSNNTSTGENVNSPTPTITPTPKPLIDVAKTVESAKTSWNNFLTSIVQFTKTILP